DVRRWAGHRSNPTGHQQLLHARLLAHGQVAGASLAQREGRAPRAQGSRASLARELNLIDAVLGSAFLVLGSLVLGSWFGVLKVPGCQGAGNYNQNLEPGT